MPRPERRTSRDPDQRRYADTFGNAYGENGALLRCMRVGAPQDSGGRYESGSPLPAAATAESTATSAAISSSDGEPLTTVRKGSPTATGAAASTSPGTSEA